MEAPSWKQQLALASLVALFAGFIARLTIPVYTSLPGLMPTAPFSVASDFVVGAFFLPFLWWRTTVGYIGAVITGIFVLTDQTSYLSLAAAAAAVPGEFYIIIIPHYIFAVLLIVGSLLAWREG